MERTQGELKCEYGKYNPEEMRDDLDATLATSQGRLTKRLLILSDEQEVGLPRLRYLTNVLG